MYEYQKFGIHAAKASGGVNGVKLIKLINLVFTSRAKGYARPPPRATFRTNRGNCLFISISDSISILFFSSTGTA